MFFILKIRLGEIVLLNQINIDNNLKATYNLLEASKIINLSNLFIAAQ